MLAKIFSILAAPLIAFGSLFVSASITNQTAKDEARIAAYEIRLAELSNEVSGSPKLGAFTYAGGKNYYLFGGGLGTSDTSVTLTSFKTPVSNYNFAMADFGSVGYGTIEPGNQTRQEFISFTGITQNTDGTAVLTGVTRGMSVVSPYTASTTLQKAHPGGTIFIVSNPPQLYNEVATKKNNETITGLWTFPNGANTPLLGASYVAPTADSQIASKKYVDSVVTGGAADMGATTKGLAEKATGAEAAATAADV